MLNNLKKYWFLYVIIAQPILDIVAYFQQDNAIGSLAGYSRLLIMCVLPLIVLWKTPKKKSFILILGIIALYCIAHILNSYRVGYISIFQDVAYLARVVQMPILAVSFIYIIKTDEYKELTSKAFLFNIVLIFVSILVAYATGTADNTYGSYGYGLLGWFANSNSQSIIIVTLIPLAIEFIMRKQNMVLALLTILGAWFLMISNGTKVAYLAIFVIFGGNIIYIILDKFIHKRKFDTLKKVVIVAYIALLGASTFGYSLTPRYDMDHLYDSSREKDQEKMDEDLKDLGSEGSTLDDMLADPIRKQEIIEYYTPLLNQDIVERFGTERVLRSYGYLPSSWMMSDIRKLKRMYSEMIWEDSDMLTHMFGFEFTNVHSFDGQGFDLENDYPALFYYYGYVGFGMYISFLGFFVLLVLRTIFKDFKHAFTSINFALILTYILQLGAAQFSGAIMRRPNVSIYLSIIIALIYFQCKQSKKDEPSC